MKLLVATKNKGKIKEIDRLLNDVGLNVEVVSLEELGITVDCPETGDTFEANAVEKSLFYNRLAMEREPDIYTVADDSGLAVEALDGRPGVLSARYAGEPKNDGNNIIKLLKELKDIRNRKAKFVSVVALTHRNKVVKEFHGEVYGEIIDERRGEEGFGYDPIFYYPPLGQTFAQIQLKEKNKISHRALAFEKLKTFILDSQG